MDDLKVIFYVVVAIVWMIYNNYKKVAETSKKRDPSKPVPDVIVENWPKTNTSPKSQEPKKQAVKREEFPENQKVDQKRGKLERTPLFKPKMASSKRKEALFLSTLEGGITKPSEIVHFDDSTNVGIDTNDFLYKIRNADFKQAIVLSEILQRPYN